MVLGFPFRSFLSISVNPLEPVYLRIQLGLMAQAYNFGYLGGKGGRLQVQGLSGLQSKDPFRQHSESVEKET